MRARAPSEVAPTSREANWAVAVAGCLYLAGALLCCTAALMPHVRSPLGVALVGIVAVITGVTLLAIWRRDRGTLDIALAADYWGIAEIAVLCWSTGGSTSPFALIYMFAIVHAAAFQSPRRFYFAAAVGLAAFLAPLVYEEVSDQFPAVACIGIALAILTSAALHFALNRIREQRRRLQILNAASASLDRSLDPGETLRAIAALAAPDFAPVCVIDVLDPSGTIGSTVVAGAEPVLAAELEAARWAPARGAAAAAPGAVDPVRELLAEAGPLTSAPAAGNGGDGGATRAGEAATQLEREAPAREPSGGPAAEQPLDGREHAAAMQDAGYVCEAAFPMLARGRVHGMISFWRRDEEAPYDRGMVSVLGDLSGRAAQAYDNARLYAERAQVARTLRRSLMPAALPSVPGLELASYFRPMGAGSEVGGDFYDVITDGDGCWLIVGDVCGKGAEAAALTGFVRHTTAAYARETIRPGHVFTRVNSAMLEQDFEGCFATAILARLSFRPVHVEVTVAVAGHPAALISRADGEVSELGGPGTLLGVFADAEIEETSTVMRPGDALTLYTDGLTEAHAPRRVLTVGQMIEQLRRAPRESAQDSIDALLGLIDPDGRVADDIAILAAQVDPR
jgi:GAF domain-containing protein